MNDLFLIVYLEDDPFSREVMGMLLRAIYPNAMLAGFDDSADFMVRVAALPAVPALFLLDVHVEPLDGFQILRLLRADRRYAASKIVAVTASVMNQEVVQLRGAGFQGAIGKPLDFDTFPGLLADVLNGKEVWHVS